MKLFNCNFLKENIRKSKEVLALLGVLLPILSIIFTFLLRSVESTDLAIITFPRMSLIASIGVFVIPPILAYCLFGFIFNKKKIDFYLSKPVSRKSIFVTNIIGGSILLVLLILICSLFFALLSMITDFVCPWLMILDYFIHWSISYLFMFYVSTFAICFAGNMITSFVIVCLCLFFYPFVNLVYNEVRGTSNVLYECEGTSCPKEAPLCVENIENCREHAQNNEFYLGAEEKKAEATFTAPLNYIKVQKYETLSIIKTIILSVAYICAGYHALKKRKMENNEVSFSNPYLHFGIKTLVFIPVVTLTMHIISSSGSAFIPISLLICAMFYLLYDLLTMKTIYKVKLSILVFSITLVLATIGTGLLIKASEIQKEVILKVNDIENIELTLRYANYDTIKIEDKSIIESILTEIIHSQQIMEIHDEHLDNITISAKGKVYEKSGYFAISENLYQKVIDYAKEIKLQSIYEKLDYNHLDYIEKSLKRMDITSELKKLLMEASYESNPSKMQNYLNLYKYENHDYKIVYFSANTTKELYNYVIHYFNNELLKKYDTIKKNGNLNFYSKDIIINAFDKERIFAYINDEVGYKFLKNHQNDEVKMESDARSVIITTNYPLRYEYTIWDVDAFISEINNYPYKEK